MEDQLQLRGYQVRARLSQHVLQGRWTDGGTEVKTGRQVILKQYRFVDGQSAALAEKHLLERLCHPGIPRLIESFATAGGVCLVLEYLPGRPLAEWAPLAPGHLAAVAAGALDILIYLQQCVPPVVHCDLTPENLLVDDGYQVYLIDFGLACSGAQHPGPPGILPGTVGFSAPEQLFGRPLGLATDLYALGASLICALTATPSAEVIRLQQGGRLRLPPVPGLAPAWVSWLETLVAPHPQERFASAVAARAAMPGGGWYCRVRRWLGRSVPHS